MWRIGGWLSLHLQDVVIFRMELSIGKDLKDRTWSNTCFRSCLFFRTLFRWSKWDRRLWEPWDHDWSLYYTYFAHWHVRDFCSFFYFWDLARSCQQCPSKLPDGDETVETWRWRWMRPAYLLTLLKKFDADVAHQVPDGARERVTMSDRDGERRHRDVESDVQLETRESRHDVPRARGETGKRISLVFAPLRLSTFSRLWSHQEPSDRRVAAAKIALEAHTSMHRPRKKFRRSFLKKHMCRYMIILYVISMEAWNYAWKHVFIYHILRSFSFNSLQPCVCVYAKQTCAQARS